MPRSASSSWASAAAQRFWRLGRNCRLPLQQGAIVISKDLGFEEYFNALVGQVPEQLAGTAAFEPSSVAR